MSDTVALVWLSGEKTPPEWPLGPVYRSEPQPAALSQLCERELAGSTAEAWLFWDPALGLPSPEAVTEALQRPGDVWHAGLRLGMGGLPGLIDHVQPTWMLNRDPPADIEASSWRLSLRACLVKTEVLRQIGTPLAGYRTLEGAALELGHRFLRGGAFTRHLPNLAPEPQATSVRLPIEDEALFIQQRFGAFWVNWALNRAALTGRITWADASRGRTAAKGAKAPPNARIRPLPPAPAAGSPLPAGRITVLIPTIDRYPYLRTLLDQLRRQTVAPDEIIVVDQTEPEIRDLEIERDFQDLPLRVIRMDVAGQCCSRNAGLEASCGEFIVLLDDDVEVEPDLIERHLRCMQQFRTSASCGVADEVGAGPMPESLTFTRLSDGFPAGNTMIRREVLHRAGLFDLAYDRGARADGDLGMRVYLSGEMIVRNHEISVLHHHAPRGGIRQHKARVVTYASSRQKLSQRHLPSVTEIYLARRYYTPLQVREMLWMRTIETMTIKGGAGKRLAKLLIGLVYLPHTVMEIRRRCRTVDEMMTRFPQIPKLDESAPVPKRAEPAAIAG